MCYFFDIMSFQFVEVHKPLLDVSRLVKAGHKVLFDKVGPTYFYLSAGEKVGMTCVGGTYEIGIWIKNPVFTRPTSGDLPTCVHKSIRLWPSWPGWWARRGLQFGRRY